METNLEHAQMGVRFSPQKSNSKTRCCVFGCQSLAKQEPTVRFHFFPKIGESQVTIINKYNCNEVVDRRYAWEKVLKMKSCNVNSRVCSLRFKKDDYILPDIPAKHRHLKKSAVPSVNLSALEPVTEKTEKKKKNDLKRTERVINRSLQKQYKEVEQKNSNRSESYDLVENESASLENIENIENENVEKAILENKNSVNNTDSHAEIEPELLQQDKAVQTKTCESKDMEVQVLFENYLNFIRDEKDLSIMTGLPSFSHLYFLENVVRIATPASASFYNKSFSKLSIKDRIILTFIKLKQNVTYGMLQVLFKVYTEENCRKIFLRMLDILSAGLSNFIHWPEKNEILKNIPECFNGFTDVRAVIDVIEIYIQSPKNLCCRLASYSTYKGGNTVRFMTAVTPAGLISFISHAYLGRSSDKAIFEESNFIKLFEKGDALMTDKGFLIDEICLKHDVKLVRPSFLKDKQQFSKEEALLNAKIAKARVHIERSNQRIKVFKILSTKVPAFLVPRIQQIMTIICAIVNLSSPILKDDKFHA